MSRSTQLHMRINCALKDALLAECERRGITLSTLFSLIATDWLAKNKDDPQALSHIIPLT